MSQSGAARLTPKQASAQAQRKAMNERRQNLTLQIRKRKKGDWLAQKRGMTPTNSSQVATTNTGTDWSSLMAVFLEQPGPASLEALQQLQSALQSAYGPNPLQDESRTSQARRLVQVVADSLAHFAAIQDLARTLGTLQVLLQLVALSSSAAASSSSSDYYGRCPPTWSELLAQTDGNVLGTTLLTLLSNDNRALLESTCWFLGSWLQDFPSAAVPLRQQRGGNKVPHLLIRLMNVDSHDVPLVQAAVWATAKLLQGDSSASGWDYLQAGWNSQLAIRLLWWPHNDPKIELDVATSVAWILVHLSQREDEILDVLLNANVDLLRNVLERLYQVCVDAQQQPASACPNNYFHHSLLEPCLQLLGHWATGCNGKYVPRLLADTPPTSRLPRTLSLIPIVEQLLRWGQQQLLPVNEYLVAVWLAGCLLCDAPTPEHPSTTIAAPTLVPLLARGLCDGSGSLECRRECALALWNALDLRLADPNFGGGTPPPELANGRRSLLDLLWRADAADEDDGYPTMAGLVRLLVCPDVDAMLAAVRILDASLREISFTRIVFQEAEGVEALERICDLPLGQDAASREAADLAADLVDDLLSDDGDDDDQFADPVLQPAVLGDTFFFGLQAPMSLPDPDNHNHWNAAAVPIGSLGMDPGMGRGHGQGMGHGRGRGRGHSPPAWAAEQVPR